MTATAEDTMTRSVIVAAPGDSVQQIARRLSEHGISAVPVCDPDRHVLGMVSEGDLMSAFGREHSLRRSWWLDLLAEGTEMAPDFLNYIAVDSRHARDVMTAPVVTVPESTTLPEIADLLAQKQIKRVPVLRDGLLVGIVSRADVVRGLANNPSGARQ